jgi:hypothetical protein
MSNATAAADAAAELAFLQSLPTTCTPMPMLPNVAAFLAIDVVLATIMTIVIGGRIYVRVNGAGMGKDDYFTIFAYVGGQ